VAEVLTDLRRDRPMSRLLQGDVGSGKTVVAAGALHAIVGDGWQGAIMAPTEVLAEQHAATLRELLTPLGVRVELVTGGVPAGEKRRIWRDVERGGVNVVVGTQAIIQRSARFARLNLAVVDEQHRFGVQQRGEIRSKGYNPHLLAMSATPIPRTLALTVYGDLNVSVLRELPRGRRPIKTSFVPTHKRGDAYGFIRREVEAGRQAFIVFPIIEESESLNARAATEEHKRLTRGAFADLADDVGLLHGRMSARAKDQVMRAFRDGEVKILVSTAVIEVGIDVPNATVILIEGAERFGLAQLHQLRGRVGRGAHASYCLLMSETTDPGENARLRTLQTVSDGFTLAERDLELRGPGDVIGTRQSGALGFRFATVTDLPTIQSARMDAEALIRSDPGLVRPEHAALAAAVTRLLQRNEWN
jgi:ATP-dependent DNA helicase RecG